MDKIIGTWNLELGTWKMQFNCRGGNCSALIVFLPNFPNLTRERGKGFASFFFLRVS